MIKHIVIINFRKSQKNYLGVLEKTRSIVLSLPGVEKIVIVPNESQYVPKDVISYGYLIDFKDQKALDHFMKDPKHFEANALFEKDLADPPFAVLTFKTDSH